MTVFCTQIAKLVENRNTLILKLQYVIKIEFLPENVLDYNI